ncbi:TetR/AcrR family transcriptional regulator [Paenibacillus tepidiphilus]|uniref:TetR/AcrR family transcriptional regulator n=1 Tax=Paenibacillus tepidiphilus TaxID=2608683 RepID=UPI001EF0A0CA|nr:TetR/AcrR family transcriptional regulator [Paenibacillus tepidiphilus]
MYDKLGLRDKKRIATAHALAEAAFELALEHGMDGFVVDDIVQRAGYSKRTFANYFSCKEEAVVTAAVTAESDRQEYDDLVAGLPEDTSPLDILYHLLQMQLAAEILHKVRRLVSLSKSHPELEPYILSVFRGLQDSAQAVLEEFSGGRYPEGYTHLLAGAAYGAFVPILDGSLNVLLPGETENGDSRAVTFDQYVDFTFNYLRNGF